MNASPSACVSICQHQSENQILIAYLHTFQRYDGDPKLKRNGLRDPEHELFLISIKAKNY